MKIGPKYKIARRLGAPIFEKTQTAKYAISLARKEKNLSRSHSRPKTDYGKQLMEKQKARFTYGVMEKQFRNYVRKALRSANPAQKLFATLESRLDNVIYRAGFAKTRLQARQMVSHGHFLVNGRRVTIPSMLISSGDIIELRPASERSVLLKEAVERAKDTTRPVWLTVDSDARRVVVKGEPKYEPNEHVFDLGQVVEFYSR